MFAKKKQTKKRSDATPFTRKLRFSQPSPLLIFVLVYAALGSWLLYTTFASPSVPYAASATPNVRHYSSIGQSANPFIHVRDILFQKYKGSKSISDIGTVVVYLIPIMVVLFLVRVRIIAWFNHLTKYKY